MLLLALILIGPPRADTRQQPTADFARLAVADARRQVGRPVRVRLEVESLPEVRDGFVVFDCTSSDSALRTVWFESGELGGDDADTAPDGRIEVVGRLAIVEHSGRRIGATTFPGFTELRLTEARRVK